MKPKVTEHKRTIAKIIQENQKKPRSLYNNLRSCMHKTKREKEAVEVLKSANDTGEKFAKGDKPTT